MNLFIADAMAQGGGGQTDALMGFLPLIIIFVIFYFLLIRPQQKKSKAHKQMVEGLSKGDEVITGGGIVGRITDVKDDFVTVEVAEGVRVRTQRVAVSSVLPKGTIKSMSSD